VAGAKRALLTPQKNTRRAGRPPLSPRRVPPGARAARVGAMLDAGDPRVEDWPRPAAACPAAAPAGTRASLDPAPAPAALACLLPGLLAAAAALARAGEPPLPPGVVAAAVDAARARARAARGLAVPPFSMWGAGPPPPPPPRELEGGALAAARAGARERADKALAHRRRAAAVARRAADADNVEVMGVSVEGGADFSWLDCRVEWKPASAVV